MPITNPWNPSKNESNQGQWPSYQRRQFQHLVSQNDKRYRGMSEAQRDHMNAVGFTMDMTPFRNNNEPAPLQEAKICRAMITLCLA